MITKKTPGDTVGASAITRAARLDSHCRSEAPAVEYMPNDKAYRSKAHPLSRWVSAASGSVYRERGSQEPSGLIPETIIEKKIQKDRGDVKEKKTPLQVERKRSTLISSELTQARTRRSLL